MVRKIEFLHIHSKISFWGCFPLNLSCLAWEMYITHSYQLCAPTHEERFCDVYNFPVEVTLGDRDLGIRRTNSIQNDYRCWWRKDVLKFRWMFKLYGSRYFVTFPSLCNSFLSLPSLPPGQSSINRRWSVNGLKRRNRDRGGGRYGCGKEGDWEEKGGGRRGRG